MKEKVLTGISIVMLFIPWTILPLRSNAWALQSPAAEIIIFSYALFMIFGGVFTAVLYGKEKMHNILIKICLVINGIYAIGGMAAISMMAMSKAM
ncbi:MAG: hypothetical protein EOM64_04865 [Erysipelotrichia bacterium]|nr:hypothetical protein [Erysipelotrichia bacterium]